MKDSWCVTDAHKASVTEIRNVMHGHAFSHYVLAQDVLQHSCRTRSALLYANAIIPMWCHKMHVAVLTSLAETFSNGGPAADGGTRCMWS